MSCSLYIAGDVYQCENTKLGNPSFISTTTKQIVYLESDGKPSAEAFIWILGNVHFENGRLQRISLQLLQALASCLASKKNTVSSVYFVDNTLRVKKVKLRHRKNTPPGACASMYHTGSGLANDQRLPRRCHKCASLELQIEKAAWPTMSSLKRRLRPELFAFVRAGLPEHVKEVIFMALLGPLQHDLLLARLSVSAKALALITPHHKTIMKISRSVHKAKVCAALEDLITHGFAVIPDLPKNTKSCFKPSILRSFNIIFLPALVNVIYFLATQKPKLGLAAPDNPSNQNGRSLREIADKEPKVIYGSRCSTPCQTFETTLALANALGCELMPIDHAHFSKTADPELRRSLQKEEAAPYKNLKCITELIEGLIHANIVAREPETGRLFVASGPISATSCSPSKRDGTGTGSGTNTPQEQTQRKEKRRKT